MVDLISRMLAPLQRQIRLMFTRGLVAMVDSSELIQILQVRAMGDELLDNIQHFEAYGYTSNPKPGAEALLAALGGNHDHMVAVMVGDRRFRLKGLKSGEVAMYTDEGDFIHFKRGNEIHIKTTKVILDCSSAEFTGDVTVAKTLTAGTDVVGGGKSLKGHRHTGYSGSTTSPPL